MAVKQQLHRFQRAFQQASGSALRVQGPGEPHRERRRLIPRVGSGDGIDRAEAVVQFRARKAAILEVPLHRRLLQGIGQLPDEIGPIFEKEMFGTSHGRVHALRHKGVEAPEK